MPSPVALRFILIAVVSLVTLAMELFLTKILSFVFWNHVVYLIISIALLGYGASSTFVLLARRRIAALGEERFLVANLLLFVCAVLAALFFVANTTPHVTLHDVHGSVEYLLGAYLALTLPFFFAGNVIVYLFVAHPRHADALYGWDLVGAAGGCLLFPLLMPALGAPRSILLLLLALCLVALPFLRPGAGSRSWPWMRAATVAAGVLLAVAMPYVDAWLPFGPDPTKSLGHALNRKTNPGAVHEHERWDVVTRLDVVGSKTPLDIGWMKLDPGVKLITFDGDAISQIQARGADFPTPAQVKGFNEHNFHVLFFDKAAAGRHLVIGLGGGPDIADSLLLGAKSIQAVDINAAIIEAMAGKFAAYSGNIFNRPNVSLHHSEGRAFLRSSSERYDVIRMTGVDTFTALSTGAYVLAENYLYTVEAFRDYFRHLGPDGVLCIHRWFYDKQPRESLRMFAIILEALRQEGVAHPEQHVAVVRSRSWSLAPTFVRKQPFARDEVARLESGFKTYGQRTNTLIEPIYLPFAGASAHPASPVYHAYAGAWVKGVAADFEARYPFDISPVTDDQPFFFNYYRVRDMFRSWHSTGPIQGYWAYFVFGLILACASAAVAVFIWLPLLVFRREGLRKQGAGLLGLYFCCLGLGFIMIEIITMQKFALLLGHPMYSIATVMGGMLVCAGIGSHLSRHFPALRALAACTLIVLAYCLFLASAAGTGLIEALLGVGLGLRILATLAIVAVGAVPLGFFFPIGLKLAGASDERFIPWAWGINSGFTVIGSVCAVAASMKIGFSMVLLLSGGIYLVALLAIWRHQAQSPAVLRG